MNASLSLIDQILEISQDYLGPAADRFVERQISTHLKKRPEKITNEDVYKLIDWIKLSFALLTNDTSMVEQYAKRLRLVADGKWSEAAGKKWAQK
jgi:hypothetical protein